MKLEMKINLEMKIRNEPTFHHGNERGNELLLMEG